MSNPSTTFSQLLGGIETTIIVEFDLFSIAMMALAILLSGGMLVYLSHVLNKNN